MKPSSRIGDLLLKSASLASLSAFMLAGTACAQQQDPDAWDQKGTAVTPKTVSSVYVPAPGAQGTAGAAPAYQITPQQREQLKTTMKQTAQQVGQVTKDFKEFYAELQKAVQDSGIVEEVNKMNLGGQTSSSSSAGSAGFGAADVKTVDETKMTVTVDLPGVDKKDLTVSLAEGSQLKIKVDRKAQDNPFDYQLAERHHGDFEKTIRLPYKAKGSSFKAELKNGVLTVTIPKEKSAVLNEVPIPIS
jgi:HSP20 family molecular chaperone IbpA